MQWSDQQQEIFSQIEKNRLINIQVNAVPGSGKTTTMVECINRTTGKVLALAFNKGIADELKQRLEHMEPRVRVATLNSIGNSIVSRKHPLSKLNAKKYQEALGLFNRDEDPGSTGSKKDRVRKEQLVGFCSVIRNYNVRPGTEEYKNIIGRFMEGSNLDLDETYRIEEMVEEAYRTVSNLSQNKSCHDFDDQIWLPVYMGWKPVYCWDWIFVDESQDLSPVQLQLLKQLGNRKTKYVFVGDRMQSIYAFRGADPMSMRKLELDFNTVQYPLPITYRCPVRVVSLLQMLFPDVYTKPNPDIGSVKVIGEFMQSGVNCFEDGGMLIARTNAGLLGACLHIHNHLGISVRLELTMEQESQLRYLKKDKNNKLIALRQKYEMIYNKLKFEVGNNPYLKWKLSEARDRHLLTKYLSIYYKDMVEAERHIESLRKANNPKIVGMSIHRSKGLEADTVYIVDLDREQESEAGELVDLEYELLTSPLKPDPKPTNAEEEMDLQQEKNVKYVAISRAKKNLFFLSTESGSPVPQIVKQWARKFYNFNNIEELFYE